MKITLVGDDTVRFENTPGPLTIEAPTPDTVYSPFQMLASAVADCTYFTVRSWATNAKLDADDLAVEVTLHFEEHPHRAGAVDVKLIWPSLPPERENAARRAAELCSVHQTLVHSPAINLALARG